MTNTECGIYCVVSEMPITSHRVISGLKHLQHRGRDSFGFSYYTQNGGIEVIKKQGFVKNPNIFEISSVWMGHVRYSTSTKMMKYCQPILSKNENKFAIVHNGNIKSDIWKTVFQKLPDIRYDTYDSDTYKLMLLIQYFQENGKSIQFALQYILDNIEGSFCILVQTKSKIYILRDRYGIKPLSYIKEQGRLIITSEADSLDYQVIEKGCLYSLDISTLQLTQIYTSENQISPETKKCIFEYIYFMKENTFFDKVSVKEWRTEIGRKLFLQSKDKFSHLDRNNTLVCGVPASGIVYGESFSHFSGFQYCQFLKKKSDYPHRTFILPDNTKRMDACRRKYFIDVEIKDKNIIILDDSVVRGNTMRFLINFLRDYQPKEIHLLVGCPEIVKPCFYGVDFPDIEELIANKMSPIEMKDYFKLDSLTFLDLKSLRDSDSYCSACFDGKYPF